MQPIRFGAITLTAKNDSVKERVNVPDQAEITVKESNDGTFRLESSDPKALSGLSAKAYASMLVHRVDGGSTLNVDSATVDVEELGAGGHIKARNWSNVNIGGGDLQNGSLSTDKSSHIRFTQLEANPADQMAKTVTLEQAEENPFLAQVYQFNKVADKLNLSESVREVLSTPYRELKVQIPVTMDDGSLRTFWGYRIQHNGALGPYKGGIRYAMDVNRDEVRSLASAMTWKNALGGLAYGGAKGGIQVNPKELSESELERLTRGYTRQIGKIIGPDRDIPAPDMGTDEQVMSWIMDEYSRLYGHSPGVVTGKPVDPFGSVGRTEATGLGAFFVMKKVLDDRNQDVKDTSLAIQGFGNVGYHMAKYAHEAGASVQAISTIDGALYNPKGLDIKHVKNYLDQGGDINKYRHDGAKAISNNELLQLDVDVLVPAAAGEVITGDNAGKIKADVILECANHPTTPKGDLILEQNGKTVVPDILTNAGGVIVSYFEWVQNKSGERWKRDEVNAKLEEKIVDNYRKVRDESAKSGMNMRDAAWAVAIQRVASADAARGIKDKEVRFSG